MIDKFMYEVARARARGLLTPSKQRAPTKRRTVSKKLRLLILERDNYKCCLCGKTAKETKLEVDHVVPVVKGGTDSLNNLRTLCIDCNRGKSDLSI
jgi:5-methylcytosine-specific restriction endonuclease McrA